MLRECHCAITPPYYVIALHWLLFSLPFHCHSQPILHCLPLQLSDAAATIITMNIITSLNIAATPFTAAIVIIITLRSYTQRLHTLLLRFAFMPFIDYWPLLAFTPPLLLLLSLPLINITLDKVIIFTAYYAITIFRLYTALMVSHAIDTSLFMPVRLHITTTIIITYHYLYHYQITLLVSPDYAFMITLAAYRLATLSQYIIATITPAATRSCRAATAFGCHHRALEAWLLACRRRCLRRTPPRQPYRRFTRMPCFRRMPCATLRQKLLASPLFTD